MTRIRKVFMVLLTITLLTSFSAAIKVKTVMVLNTIWFYKSIPNSKKRSLISRRCTLNKVESCSIQGKLCSVKLHFSNCEGSFLEATSGYCNPKHVQYKAKQYTCKSSELDGRVINLWKPKSPWDTSGFKIQTDKGQMYTFGDPISSQLVKADADLTEQAITGLLYVDSPTTLKLFGLNYIPQWMHMKAMAEYQLIEVCRLRQKACTPAFRKINKEAREAWESALKNDYWAVVCGAGLPQCNPREAKPEQRNAYWQAICRKGKPECREYARAVCEAALPECHDAVKLAFENPERTMFTNSRHYHQKDASSMEIATIIIGLASFCALIVFISYYCFRINQGSDRVFKKGSVKPQIILPTQGKTMLNDQSSNMMHSQPPEVKDASKQNEGGQNEASSMLEERSMATDSRLEFPPITSARQNMSEFMTGGTNAAWPERQTMDSQNPLIVTNELVSKYCTQEVSILGLSTSFGKPIKPVETKEFKGKNVQPTFPNSALNRQTNNQQMVQDDVTCNQSEFLSSQAGQKSNLENSAKMCDNNKKRFNFETTRKID